MKMDSDGFSNSDLHTTASEPYDVVINLADPYKCGICEEGFMHHLPLMKHVSDHLEENKSQNPCSQFVISISEADVSEDEEGVLVTRDILHLGSNNRLIQQQPFPKNMDPDKLKILQELLEKGVILSDEKHSPEENTVGLGALTVEQESMEYPLQLKEKVSQSPPLTVHHKFRCKGKLFQRNNLLQDVSGKKSAGRRKMTSGIGGQNGNTVSSGVVSVLCVKPVIRGDVHSSESNEVARDFAKPVTKLNRGCSKRRKRVFSESSYFTDRVKTNKCISNTKVQCMNPKRRCGKNKPVIIKTVSDHREAITSAFEKKSTETSLTADSQVEPLTGPGRKKAKQDRSTEKSTPAADFSSGKQLHNSDSVDSRTIQQTASSKRYQGSLKTNQHTSQTPPKCTVIVDYVAPDTGAKSNATSKVDVSKINRISPMSVSPRGRRMKRLSRKHKISATHLVHGKQSDTEVISLATGETGIMADPSSTSHAMLSKAVTSNLSVTPDPLVASNTNCRTGATYDTAVTLIALSSNTMSDSAAEANTLSDTGALSKAISDTDNIELPKPPGNDKVVTTNVTNSASSTLNTMLNTAVTSSALSSHAASDTIVTQTAESDTVVTSSITYDTNISLDATTKIPNVYNAASESNESCIDNSLNVSPGQMAETTSGAKCGNEKEADTTVHSNLVPDVETSLDGPRSQDKIALSPARESLVMPSSTEGVSVNSPSSPIPLQSSRPAHKQSDVETNESETTSLRCDETESPAESSHKVSSSSDKTQCEDAATSPSSTKVILNSNTPHEDSSSAKSLQVSQQVSSVALPLSSQSATMSSSESLLSDQYTPMTVLSTCQSSGSLTPRTSKPILAVTPTKVSQENSASLKFSLPSTSTSPPPKSPEISKSRRGSKRKSEVELHSDSDILNKSASSSQLIHENTVLVYMVKKPDAVSVATPYEAELDTDNSEVGSLIVGQNCESDPCDPYVSKVSLDESENLENQQDLLLPVRPDSQQNRTKSSKKTFEDSQEKDCLKSKDSPVSLSSEVYNNGLEPIVTIERLETNQARNVHLTLRRNSDQFFNSSLKKRSSVKLQSRADERSIVSKIKQCESGQGILPGEASSFSESAIGSGFFSDLDTCVRTAQKSVSIHYFDLHTVGVVPIKKASHI